MIGDIFAHRSIVPKYVFTNAIDDMVDETDYASGNSGDGKSCLVKKHFNYGSTSSEWEDFGLKYGDKLQFTTLKKYAKDTY